MHLFYTDKSKDDVELAFMWYEKQQKGLGFEFLDCIEASLNNILNFPEMYEVKNRPFGRLLPIVFIYFDALTSCIP